MGHKGKNLEKILKKIYKNNKDVFKQTKTIDHRTFNIQEEGYLIHYVADYSKIAREYNQEVIKRYYISLGLKKKKEEVTYKKGFIIHKLSSKKSLKSLFLERVYEEPNYLNWLISKKESCETNLLANLKSCEDNLKAKRRLESNHLKELVNSGIEYSSLVLDSLISFDHIKKLIYNKKGLTKEDRLEILNGVMYSSKSFYSTIHKNFLSLLVDYHLGEDNINNFIEDIGVLTAYDLKEGNLEDYNVVFNKLMKYKKNYPILSKVQKEIENIKFKETLNKTKMVSTLRKLKNLFGKDSTDTKLLKINTTFLDYNEEHRFYRNRVYRCLRKTIKRIKKDINKISLNKLYKLLK